jgi:zinc transporter 7
MVSLQPRRVAILLAFAIACVYAEKHAASVASMSVPEIAEKLQVHANNTAPEYLT